MMCEKPYFHKFFRCELNWLKLQKPKKLLIFVVYEKIPEKSF